MQDRAIFLREDREDVVRALEEWIHDNGGADVRDDQKQL